MIFQMLVPVLQIAPHCGRLHVRLHERQIPLFPKIGDTHVLFVSLRDVDPPHELITQELHSLAGCRIMLVILVAKQVTTLDSPSVTVYNFSGVVPNVKSTRCTLEDVTRLMSSHVSPQANFRDDYDKMQQICNSTLVL